VPVALATSEGTSFELAARKGFMLLVSQYDSAARVKLKGERYVELAAAGGRALGREMLRVCRYVYVSESVEQAKADLRATLEPSVAHHKRNFPHHFLHSLPPSGLVEDVTLDFLIDEGHYFIGDPDRVYELLRNFYAETGGFGTLLLLKGKDWGSREQRSRSMRLFAEHVAPRLAPLQPSNSATPVAAATAAAR
jgi:alkanesulfonate monooxygenase SsuD/methylene tetrahydromethanopterin reductase-like flavin-dependent oxidoreductase (luciferase family)